MQKQFDAGQIPFSYLLKKDVKPAEKTRRFMSFLMRFDYQAQRDGVSVSATSAEISTETAIVTENC